MHSKHAIVIRVIKVFLFSQYLISKFNTEKHRSKQKRYKLDDTKIGVWSGPAFFPMIIEHWNNWSWKELSMKEILPVIYTEVKKKRRVIFLCWNKITFEKASKIFENTTSLNIFPYLHLFGTKKSRQ